MCCIYHMSVIVDAESDIIVINSIVFIGYEIHWHRKVLVVNSSSYFCVRLLESCYSSLSHLNSSSSSSSSSKSNFLLSNATGIFVLLACISV